MDASNYVDSLISILRKTEVTDFQNSTIEFNKGVELVVNLIKAQSEAGKKIIFIGNGGSAAIASHETIDFWKNGKIRSICFNEGALLTCIGNDYGYSHVFEKPIEMFADPGDVLVAISSSGKSENILLGADAAVKIGCKVVTFSGFSNTNPLRIKGHYNFYIDSGSYGYVELSHQIILHMLLDIIMETRV